MSSVISELRQAESKEPKNSRAVAFDLIGSFFSGKSRQDNAVRGSTASTKCSRRNLGKYMALSLKDIPEFGRNELCGKRTVKHSSDQDVVSKGRSSQRSAEESRELLQNLLHRRHSIFLSKKS
mmetsp:Transcript_16571/g.19180  ORF Transcript_16571/g.19180 Transcript_16571/m.19180 type:complete len:123 (-) Transcript_16571:526-894(-)|eukprot:CAMPEP_0168341642 /NCGR_PEP_ID=MMETSP0213-20121227/14840_1 /TAXON_ID=151035 /ORGANISM="Euplotes harpa, Strain FSP1.4" /LENGTH=122 /DNA_ID=CAMNT_0008348227 /DNA_START=219 /DNA_END=587 /DNA_ORIENTATION=+